VENYKTPQLEQPATKLRFKLGFSRMQVYTSLLGSRLTLDVNVKEVN
jgi:hypothetical protein